MGLEDTSGSSGSGGVPDSSHARALRQKQERLKLDVYNDVLRQLRDAGVPEGQSPSFEDELWRHFNRLPARYALDVNVERPGDVLAHKKLLEQAQEAANTPVFAVRLVQVAPDGSQPDSSDSNTSRIGNAQSPSTYFRHSVHPPPAFGSSTNLEDLALEASRQDNSTQFPRPMHEIAFAMHERPKLLSLLTSLLSEIGLNIQEVHAFSTNDGYSLDVFVVDGWPYEETEQLRDLLQKKTHSLEKEAWPSSHPWSPRNGSTQIGDAPVLNHVETPTDGTDQWDIDFQQLKFGDKEASGSHGDLYRGTYCGQEVAIKVLKTECVDDDMHREFAQEVSIMRKVHHRNVVKFIGACTKPRLCIITEFMTGGSVYDFLHKKKGTFELPTLLRVAIDVCNGMNYLHQNNIIHRDLKSANLLMDENKLVKVADFGVARIQSESGVMTAETGTYRWMAPEIIEHKPYDHKADVFSFGIVLWELLTAKIPYQYLTPIQAAVGVVQKGLRPTIPSNTHPKLAELMERCWEQDPADRPAFSEVLEIIQLITEEVRDEPDECQNEKRPSFGLLSILRSLPLLNRFCCL